MDFTLDLKLSRLAAISFATSLLNDSYFYNCIRSCNLKCKSSWWDSDDYTRLIRETIKKFEKHLPKSIINLVLYVLESMIIRRWFLWDKKLKGRFGFSYFNLGKMYWTCYGTVDTAKIVKEEWTSWFDASGMLKSNLMVHFPGSSVEQKTLIARRAMDYMACSCVLIDYIEANFCQMLQHCEGHIQLGSMIEDEICFIKHSVFSLIDPEKLKTYPGIVFHNHVFKKVTSWRNKNTISGNMFSLSVEHGCDIAVRYYWQLLSSEEKYNCLLPTALNCCKTYDQARFRKEKYIFPDVVIFLFMQMTKDQKHMFLLDNFHRRYYSFFTNHFFNAWPWEETFFYIYEKKRISYDKKYQSSLLQEIAENMKRINRVGYDYKTTIYYRMFSVVLEEMQMHTSNRKKFLIPSYCDNGNIFLELFDFQILKSIIDLECESDEYRKQLIKPTYNNVFGKLVRENKFHVLEEFLEQVLDSQDEIKKWFKKYSDWHPEFVKRADFEALENLLAWQCETDEERLICRSAAVEHSDVAEGADVGWITNIWISCLENSENDELGIEKAKSKTSEFLKWLFERDKDIERFKKQLLHEGDSEFFTFELIINRLLFNGLKSVQAMGELLKCFMRPKSLARFKAKVANEYPEWLRFLRESSMDPDDFLNFFGVRRSGY